MRILALCILLFGCGSRTNEVIPRPRGVAPTTENHSAQHTADWRDLFRDAHPILPIPVRAATFGMRAAELRTAVPAIVERNGYLSIVDEQVPVMYGFTWSNEQLTAVTVYLATELNFGDVQGHLEGTWGAPIAYETAHGGRFPIWRSDAVEAWLYTRPHGEATLEFRVPHPDAE